MLDRISRREVIGERARFRGGSSHAAGDEVMKRRWDKQSQEGRQAGGEDSAARRQNFCAAQPPKLQPTHQDTPHTMAPSRAPLKAGEFTVLPLTVPGVPSFPQQTTHFLYIRPHAPKIPDENAPRSLFASNLPIDATESSLRALFAKQLGGARIERVEIEGVRPKKSTRGTAISAKAGKKRKRGAEPSLGDIGLPDTWDAEILSSGSGAVLVFVDKASAELAMKEIARLAKKKAEVMWASDISLGVESECPCFSFANYGAT